MPIVVPEGYGIASLNYTLVGDPQPMSVTFGVFSNGGPPPDELAATIDGVATTSGFCTATRLNDGYTYVGVEVRYMAPGGFITYVEGNSVEGTRPQSPVISNTSVLVKKVTQLGGRRNQGRMYLPAAYASVAETTAAGGLLSDALTALQEVATDFKEALLTADIDMVLFHSEAPTEPTLITGLQVQPILATQRRRMRP